MSTEASIVFLVQRIGPYHHARLCALVTSRGGAVAAIEFRPSDAVYAWAPVEEEGGYARFQTHSQKQLNRALDRINPEVVVCVGYFDPEIHQAVIWAFRHGVALVTCSDSTHEDEPRKWAKEALKRRVVASFDAALVAGHRARGYVAGLGLSDARQFVPWDVVDNSYFREGADAGRVDGAVARSRLKLPHRYFLCVARFVPKKNLRRLIDAYARYVGRSSGAAWSLVLSGSGPLEVELRACVAKAGLEASVHFPGFLHYPDLPACYGLASAFILPSVSDQWGLVVNEAMAAGLPVLVSNRCGCAPDLVHEGENGFTFDPENTEQIADLLTRLAHLGQTQRLAMGQRSREIVKAFSPQAFARGLEAAIGCALTQPRKRAPWPNRVLINFLALRSPRNT